jgi:hypothetical protein
MEKFIRFLSYNSLQSLVVFTCFCLVSTFLAAGCRNESEDLVGDKILSKDKAKATSSSLSVNAVSSSELMNLAVKDFSFMKEGDKIIALALSKPVDKRIELLSAYFLGRKYRPDTKDRIKKQRKAEKSEIVKKEATNSSPLPVKVLATSFQYLDCMTYVEHVLALASVESVPSQSTLSSHSDTDKSDKKIHNIDKGAEGLETVSWSPWKDLFLNRLIDVMFDAKGEPLMNHMRSHFVSMWARKNVEKGYLIDLAKGHKDSAVRKVILNKVKDNRTFYVEDAFMVFDESEDIHYFTVETLIKNPSILKSGDVLALVCDKEGLDVVHMGFYIEKSEPGKNGKSAIFRHASFSDNKVMDSDFVDYMSDREKLVGLMAFRPVLKAPRPFAYEIADKSKSGGAHNSGESIREDGNER